MLAGDGRAGRTLALAAAIVGALAWSALSASDPADFVTVARGDPNTKPWDAAAISISANGRYVAFTSNARLTAVDQNTVSDIYVLDRQMGGVSLETPHSGPGARSATAPHLSATGRFLIYETPENGSGPPVQLLMLRDRQSGVTCSLPAAAGTPAFSSRGARLSANGDRIVFSSTGMIVEGTDANGGAEDVYLFDVGTERYQRVSLDNTGRQPAAGMSYAPAISADGRFVAFTSSAILDASPATPERRSAFRNIYLRDTLRGATLRISVSESGRQSNGSSYEAAISADGRYVAFVSEATNLMKQRDTNRAPDVYLRDTIRNVTELVSAGVAGNPANGTSAHPSVSADGRIVVFQSDASNLVCGVRCADGERDINLVADIFVRNRESGTTSRISRGATPWMEPSVGPAIDGTGTVVAFSSRHPRSATDDTDDFDLFVWSVQRF